MIDAAGRHGIATTVSLIVGFPDENWDDLRETADMYAHSMRHANSFPQMNLLAPLSGTPIYWQYKDQMTLEEFGSEMSHQGRSHNEADRSLIRKYPHIFPNFYLLPAPALDRTLCHEFMEFLSLGERRMRWLLTALHQNSTGILEVFFDWQKRRMETHPQLNRSGLRHYYRSRAFGDDFLIFARERFMSVQIPVVDALLAFYQTLSRESARDALLPRGRLVTGRVSSKDIPVRVKNLHILELDWDIQHAIESLKHAAPRPQLRGPKFYRTKDTGKGEVRLMEISPLIARALRTCDGRHTAGEFIGRLSKCFGDEAKAAGVLLRGIQKKGFIEIYRMAPLADSNQSGAGTNSEYSSVRTVASKRNHRFSAAQ
jgi:hypothetical protein